MADKKVISIEIKVSEKNAAVTVNKTKTAVDGLTASTKKLAKATEQNKTNSGLNNAIIAESARLASDASYGFNAIANNLGQLVSLFSMSSKAAGGLGSAIKALFTAQSLFLIGLQLVITYGSKLFDMFTKLTGGSNLLMETFKNAGKEVQTTSGRFETYIRTLQDTNKSQEQQRRAVEKLNKQYPDFVQNLKDAGYSTEDLKDKTADIITITNRYRESLVKLAMARAAQTKIEELSGEYIQLQIDTNEKLKESGLTLDKAREISAKKDEFFANMNIKSVRGRTRASDQYLTSQVRLADKAVKEHDKEQVRIQESINALTKYTIIELDSSSKRAKAAKGESEEKNKYHQLEIGNFDRYIQALREMGRIRDHFFNKELQIEVDREKNSIKAIQLEKDQNINRLNALKEQGLSEEQLAVAKYQVNIYYAKLLQEEQNELDKQGYAMKMQMFQQYANALGSVSQLMKENSDAQKAFALAEIVANTAIGMSNGLVLAQEQALSAPPVSTMAFPLFYASQIAAVLAAAAKAKSILSGGSIGGGGGQAGGRNVEAPDFNVVGASPESQLAQSVSMQQNQPIKAFVVSRDMTNQQELDRVVTNTASL